VATRLSIFPLKPATRPSKSLAYSRLTGLAIQSDGKIMVAGASVNYYDYAYVARYLASSGVRCHF